MQAQIIPGLHNQPSPADLTAALDVYNHLVSDLEQPDLSEQQLKKLALLFVRYNLQDTFGIHLIHRHLHVPSDHIMMGSRLSNGTSGWWTRPTPITEALNSSLHGHIFKVSNNRLGAYEFREGPPLKDIKDVDEAFFRELIDVLNSNNLENLVGLQVLDYPPQQPMLEFIIAGEGAVMIRAEGSITNWELHRITGWVIAKSEDGGYYFKGNETHAGPPGAHEIFRDGKKLKDVMSPFDTLVAQSIIAALDGNSALA